MVNKTVWGGTAYLTIVEIYQTGPVNYLMGGFRFGMFRPLCLINEGNLSSSLSQK